MGLNSKENKPMQHFFFIFQCPVTWEHVQGMHRNNCTLYLRTLCTLVEIFHLYICHLSFSKLTEGWTVFCYLLSVIKAFIFFLNYTHILLKLSFLKLLNPKVCFHSSSSLNSVALSTTDGFSSSVFKIGFWFFCLWGYSFVFIYFFVQLIIKSLLKCNQLSAFCAVQSFFMGISTSLIVLVSSLPKMLKLKDTIVCINI